MKILYNFFIASHWSNKNVVMELSDQLRAKEKTAYSYLESEPNNPENPLAAKQRAQQGFEIDTQALGSSQFFILLLPAGKSAHIAAGMAWAMRQKMILIGEPEQTENFYFVFSEVFPTVQDFLATFK